jgi:riboflavin kinase/FMN adenylyltransferase
MNNAVAFGKFDALHVGHRALAERAMELGTPRLLRLTGLAKAFGWPARAPLVAEQDRARVLATWQGHPDEAVADFAALRALEADGFLDWLQRTHAATALVVGADFRCGRGRAAGVAELAPLCVARGLQLAVVAPVLVGGLVASSSRVRDALAAGDVTTAALCLGRPHRLVGTVVRGDGRGRRLGFPTANLGRPRNQAPAPGVYAARAVLAGGSWPAAVNVGVLPTVGAERPLSVEAHLIGYAGDCYGADLALDLTARIRDERRFASLDELTAQIARDIAAVTPT